MQVSLGWGVESAQREIAGSCGRSGWRNPRMVSTVTIDLHPSAVSNSFFFPTFSPTFVKLLNDSHSDGWGGISKQVLMYIC